MSSKSRTGAGGGVDCKTGFSRESDFPQDTSHPAFSPYRDLLARLPSGRFPSPGELTALLPTGVSSAGGAPIRFLPADSLPGVDYERQIFETGQVSTREDNRHDLFNALVWCRLPRLKAAMNALHCRHLGDTHGGRRGPVRDALTLLDESGALVVSSNRVLLDALAEHDWHAAFQAHGADWGAAVQVVICGHALLEKLLNPYKAITAQALLLQVADNTRLSGQGGLQRLDETVAEALLREQLLGSTADLSPLPLAGIPGWWSAGPQDPAFYSDPAVFRPAGHARITAQKHSIS